MKLTVQDHPALVLIDIQKGFDNTSYWGGQRNNPGAEDNAGRLLHLWRQIALPIFHIQHCSSHPTSILSAGNWGHRFKEQVVPRDGESVIQKNVNSAFIGTNLKDQLDRAGIKRVVIVGLTTDHCVSTTTRMAGNYGYDTYIVADATATFCKRGINGQVFSAELIHDTALASLRDEFASVVTTEQVLDELSSKSR